MRERTDRDRMDFIERFMAPPEDGRSSVPLSLSGSSGRGAHFYSINPRRNLAVKNGRTAREVIDQAMAEYEGEAQ